jgi:hypothetical protein
MTFAWYGNFRYANGWPLWKIILISWLIAFFEYCFMVPANRWGHQYFTTAQLKLIQEVVTLTVFAFFSVLYLKESFKWNYLAAFACILLAVYFMFRK